MVDTRSSSPMLYLPLDKLIQQSGPAQAPAAGGDHVEPPAVSLPDLDRQCRLAQPRQCAHSRP
jgi:membrane protease subunit HflK